MKSETMLFVFYCKLKIVINIKRAKGHYMLSRSCTSLPSCKHRDKYLGKHNICIATFRSHFSL